MRQPWGRCRRDGADQRTVARAKLRDGIGALVGDPDVASVEGYSGGIIAGHERAEVGGVTRANLGYETAAGARHPHVRAIVNNSGASAAAGGHGREHGTVAGVNLHGRRGATTGDPHVGAIVGDGLRREGKSDRLKDRNIRRAELEERVGPRPSGPDALTALGALRSGSPGGTLRADCAGFTLRSLGVGGALEAGRAGLTAGADREVEGGAVVIVVAADEQAIGVRSGSRAQRNQHEDGRGLVGRRHGDAVEFQGKIPAAGDKIVARDGDDLRGWVIGGALNGLIIFGACG